MHSGTCIIIKWLFHLLTVFYPLLLVLITCNTTYTIIHSVFKQTREREATQADICLLYMHTYTLLGTTGFF